MEPIPNSNAMAVLPGAKSIKLHGDKAAAQYLSVCVMTVRKLRKLGKIPYSKVLGKYFYNTLELDETFHHPVNEGRVK